MPTGGYTEPLIDDIPIIDDAVIASGELTITLPPVPAFIATLAPTPTPVKFNWLPPCIVVVVRLLARLKFWPGATLISFALLIAFDARLTLATAEKLAQPLAEPP